MKKIIITILILSLAISLLAGCNKVNKQENIGNSDKEIEKTEEEEEVIEVPSRISDYFPFKENTIYSYEGEGNEYAEKKTFFEYIDDNRAQIKTINPGTESISVLEYKDGELREIFFEGEIYYIENLINNIGESKDYQVILKEPLKVGSTWELKDGSKRTITGSNIEIDTPYNKFKALEVTTELGGNKKQLDYYVNGIGLVATIYKDGDFVVKSLLKDLVGNSGIDQEIKFYYPSATDLNTVYTNVDIQFNTNDKIEGIIERNFSNPPSEDVMSPLSSDTHINSIKLDRKKGIVRVDFTKEFVEEMSGGSAFETIILNSIINTLGDYYGVNKVYISTDGVPYSSGHYAIKEDEYFTTDYTETIELE